MNFAVDVVEAADAEGVALVELDRAGGRREHRFGAVAQAVRTMATELHGHGVRRGDVVLTLAGNQPDWVVAMVACFRQGFVVLPCTEQLRAKDLRLRLDVTQPVAVVADRRNADVLAEAGWDGPTIWGPGVMDRPAAAPGDVPPAADLAPLDPCLITFTSGTTGEPKAVLHGQRYLDGQRLQAEHWLSARPGDLVWCTAASGWSKSARNVFIAPWLRGATALLHDARFDPAERLDILERERVAVLCMAPTEYRVIAKRVELRRFPDLRALVAAGEALNPEVLEVWRDATGLEIRDGYGQTETGQLTGNLDGEPARAGSMGRALPGVKLWIEDGELVADPATVPTFFLRYLGEDGPDPATEPWHTGDRVIEDDDGYLFFEGRTDDVIISAGYRIGPFEVESALVAHPAVAEAAVVAAPDEERGSVVRAIVVLRDDHAPSDDLVRALQNHVKDSTAPYKYPRIVEFADDLPKTSSGKVRRALLRGE
ncbi:acyl-CoA synthetase [Baekduia sp.]|jgi:acyl-coenzyme A synthetase/AMP-(fatty) acid ligase|uniref:acyl-CoA synthetase n=1 Tax=Baekduia sp. TaxID=2600305 RepID=UPI002DF7640F|nr:AMP-binding protein [Baekduia sp.]